MFLDEFGVIWGVNLNNAKEYGVLRRYVNIIITLACVIVTISILSIMKSNTITFGDYFQTLVLLAIIFYALHGLCVRNNLYRVYRFYRKYRKASLIHEQVRLKATDLYDVLYKTRKVRLKEDDTIESYVSVIYESCCLDQSYSRRLLRNLKRVETSEDGILMDLYYVEKGKNCGLVSLSRAKVASEVASGTTNSEE